MERKSMDDFNLKESNNSDARSQKVTRLPLTSDYVFKRIFARINNEVFSMKISRYLNYLIRCEKLHSAKLFTFCYCHFVASIIKFIVCMTFYLVESYVMCFC